MLTLLNHPGYRSRALPLSVAAWHGMIAANLAPERAELIRGVIVEKMSKSTLHTILISYLFELLLAWAKPGHWVRSEAPLTLTDSQPEPDISVVTGKRGDYLTSHPRTAALVIEIAVSSLAEDRELAELYAEAGVLEYWIVNATERCIEVHRQPSAGRYQAISQHRVSDSLACQALPGFHCDVAALFAELS
jgi:Uma2 family endonuclease